MEEIGVTHTVTSSHFFRSVTVMHVVYERKVLLKINSVYVFYQCLLKIYICIYHSVIASHFLSLVTHCESLLVIMWLVTPYHSQPTWLSFSFRSVASREKWTIRMFSHMDNVYECDRTKKVTRCDCVSEWVTPISSIPIIFFLPCCNLPIWFQ
jgi:hypothetical protein